MSWKAVHQPLISSSPRWVWLHWLSSPMLYLYEFTGFVSLIALPLSQLLTNWVMHITKCMLAAKDKQMTLINEMFGLIKFIKFLAWEGKWIKKVMEAWKVQMKWLKKTCPTLHPQACHHLCLVTKIGPLSHCLDFLMTESDLWHEKFITFECYAEKLSNEATELCAKINKEQNEKLHETEDMHHTVIIKLEEMCQNIIKMEDKCFAMVTEVGAQTKSSLQSVMISKSHLKNVHDEELKAPISPHTSRLSSGCLSLASGSGSHMLHLFGMEMKLTEDGDAEAEGDNPDAS
ncbi:hypothetical protein K439DRAFT_1625259 [Ramaria rubella]|nr:hypothetical protein K439DRAFT_1625259 [Ramaria rubella]